ncbi:hypothetical protein ACTFIT_011101 [Dictyostelium discoideum]
MENPFNSNTHNNYNYNNYNNNNYNNNNNYYNNNYNNNSNNNRISINDILNEGTAPTTKSICQNQIHGPPSKIITKVLDSKPPREVVSHDNHFNQPNNLDNCSFQITKEVIKIFKSIIK